MNLGIGISDSKFVWDALTLLCQGLPNATVNFIDLRSEVELFLTGLKAAKEFAGTHTFSAQQQKHVDFTLKKCDQTLRRLRRFLESGRSLATGIPNVKAIFDFSNDKVSEWTDKIESRNLNLLMVYAMSDSASSAVVEQKLDHLASLVEREATRIESSSTRLSVATTDTASTASRDNWDEICHVLKERGISKRMLKKFKERIILHVERIVLEEHEEPVNEDLTPDPRIVGTSLLTAAARGDWGEVEHLLEDSPHFEPRHPDVLKTYSLAVHNHEWNTVKLLVRRGLSPDGQSVDPQPAAISVAAESQAWGTVEFLATNRANLEVRIRQRATRDASLTHDQGAREDELQSPRRSRITTPPMANTCQTLNKVVGSSGDTILIAAAAARRWSTVALLVECGANVNAVGQDGKTTLHYVFKGLAPHLHLLTNTGQHNQAAKVPSQEALDVDKVAVLLLQRGVKPDFQEWLPVCGGTAFDELRRRITDLSTMPEGLKSLLVQPIE
ncbi:hypothetical protein BJX64DRAFT_173852 [Aspergillus heterothallicus]